MTIKAADIIAVEVKGRRHGVRPGTFDIDFRVSIDAGFTFTISEPCCQFVNQDGERMIVRLSHIAGIVLATEGATP